MFLRRDFIYYFKKHFQAYKDLFYCIRNDIPISLIRCCDVDVRNIPENTHFPHPYGIVIGKASRIGTDCIIFQNVTVGARYPGTSNPGHPTIGSNAVLGAGSIIFGDITVGDNVMIGAGAIVFADVPAGTTVTGVWK